MPGNDSSYQWQFNIPENETPFQYNPERGFVSSANQRPSDSSYPYYLGRDYPMFRGLYVNRQLSYMNAITIQDMIALQNSNYNLFAEMAMPVMLNHLDPSDLGVLERKYFDELKKWNFNDDKDSKAAVVFDVFWKHLREAVYDDEYAGAPKIAKKPDDVTLLEGLVRDSVYHFTDNIQIPNIENLDLIMLSAFRATAKEIEPLESSGKWRWGAYKDAHISHLLKLPAFSAEHPNLGGGKNDINAITSDHGPSWRMVVQLSNQPEAYGIYPGGQSGNPGSRYYNNTIENWSKGDYYQLWMMQSSQQADARIRGTMHFVKG
jgi:penicillin amidase